MITRIVSGGQTGVDRAALDAAMFLAIDHGGWCPKGRRAEDGKIPEKYLLQETPELAYAQRTGWNVRDSDGTIIIKRGLIRGGTAYTMRCCEQSGKPCLIVSLDEQADHSKVKRWLSEQHIKCLNIAGPRKSQDETIYELAYQWIISLKKIWQQ